MHRILPIVLVVLCSAGAYGEPDRRNDWYKRGDILALLSQVHLNWGDLVARLQVRQLGPGAYWAVNRRTDEIGPVTTLGRILVETQGVSLLLISRVGDNDVPAFDGIVVDERSKAILANFTLKSFVSAARQAPKTNASLDTTTAYSRSEAWIEAFMRHSNRNPVSTNPNRTYYQVHPKFLEDYQTMHQIFVTTPARPTWALASNTLVRHAERDV